MATVIQFWESDGPNGEALIREYRTTVLQAIADAGKARPSRTAIVIMHDTRNNGRDTLLWVRPGYISGTTPEGSVGFLNELKKYL